MYAVKKLTQFNFEVVNLKDDTPIVYQVSKSKKGHYSCNCMGYSRQKDKTQHKHCLMVKALEEMQHFDSILLDSDWKVLQAHSMNEALAEMETFISEIAAR
jgi:hypothetical protein